MRTLEQLFADTIMHRREHQEALKRQLHNPNIRTYREIKQAIENDTVILNSLHYLRRSMQGKAIEG